MKKIGLVTFHKAYNYGTALQAYALYKKCNENGKTEIVDYYNHTVYSEYNLIRPFKKNNIIKSTLKKFLDLYNYNKRKKRKISFEKFINEKTNQSKCYINEEELKKDKLNYDILVTGSDQLWNKYIVGELSDIYTLNFGNEKIKKISYAASIGDLTQVEKYKEEFKEKISKIDKISVREKSAQESLSKIIEKKIDTVLDPTLLIEKEEWEKEIKELPKPKEKYILAYVVNRNKEYKKIVNYLSEQTGLKVIHFGEFKHTYKNVLKNCYTEGPLEFINYIKNAEYVVATSFHATVFSTIFNKKFFIIPHKTTGSRVTDLLSKLKIENRVYYTLDEFKKIDYDFKTNWEIPNKILKEEKNKSEKWLEEAINND